MSPYLSESYIIFINIELLLKSYWSQKLDVSWNRTLKWVEIFKKENTGHMLWSILVGSLIECAFYLVNPDLQKNKHARIYQKGNVFKYYQLYKLTRKFFREILAGAFVLGFCEMATNKKILDYVIYPYGFSILLIYLLSVKIQGIGTSKTYIAVWDGFELSQQNSQVGGFSTQW